MKKFSELGIKPSTNRLTCEKIKIAKILNKEIIVKGYRLETSKFGKNKSGKCLYLQIELEKNNHIVFTGSDVLIDLIQQVDDEHFPFVATIIKEGESFEFR
jgi:hypothetical protein